MPSKDYQNFATGSTVLHVMGTSSVPDSTTVTVTQTTSSGFVSRASGATVPADGEVNYSTGCYFIKTNGGLGNTAYINEGSSTAAAFRSLPSGGVMRHPSSAAINATATATAAQVATGYITSTSAATTTITLPTGTLLGGVLGATAGTVFDLIVDNTAGANVVTIAVAVNGVLSDAATGSAASFGDLTIASGATGIARYTLMFSSATAYAFTRTA